MQQQTITQVTQSSQFDSRIHHQDTIQKTQLSQVDNETQHMSTIQMTHSIHDDTLRFHNFFVDM